MLSGEIYSHILDVRWVCVGRRRYKLKEETASAILRLDYIFIFFKTRTVIKILSLRRMSVTT